MKQNYPLLIIGLLCLTMIRCTGDVEEVQLPVNENATSTTRSSPEGELMEYHYEYDEPEGEIIVMPNGLEAEYIDGEYYIFGDIEVTEEELNALGTEGTRTVYMFLEKRRWARKYVNYKIDNSISDRSGIMQAMKMWSDACGIRFTEGTGNDYILFKKAKKNKSALGRRGGKQRIKLKSLDSPGIIAHEIGHALGLIHEHQHPNRDRFINLRLWNVKIWHRPNFWKIDWLFNIKSLHDTLDFNSIMMYGSDSYASFSNPSIVKKDGSLIYAQRKYISLYDILTIREMYGEGDIIKSPNKYYSHYPETFRLDIPGARNVRWNIPGINSRYITTTDEGRIMKLYVTNNDDVKDIHQIDVEFTLPNAHGGEQTYNHTLKKVIPGEKIHLPVITGPTIVRPNQVCTFEANFDHPHWGNTWLGFWAIDEFDTENGYEILDHHHPTRHKLTVRFKQEGKFNVRVWADNTVDPKINGYEGTRSFSVSGSPLTTYPYINRPNGTEYVNIGQQYNYLICWDEYKAGRMPHVELSIGGSGGYELKRIDDYDFNIVFKRQGNYTINVKLFDDNRKEVGSFSHPVSAGPLIEFKEGNGGLIGLEVEQTLNYKFLPSDPGHTLKIESVKSSNSWYQNIIIKKIDKNVFQITGNGPCKYTLNCGVYDNNGRKVKSFEKTLQVIQVSPIVKTFNLEQPPVTETIYAGVEYLYKLTTTKYYYSPTYYFYFENSPTDDYDFSRQSNGNYRFKVHSPSYSFQMGADFLVNGAVIDYKTRRINVSKSQIVINN